MVTSNPWQCPWQFQLATIMISLQLEVIMIVTVSAANFGNPILEPVDDGDRVNFALIIDSPAGLSPIPSFFSPKGSKRLSDALSHAEGPTSTFSETLSSETGSSSSAAEERPFRKRGRQYFRGASARGCGLRCRNFRLNLRQKKIHPESKPKQKKNK